VARLVPPERAGHRRGERASRRIRPWLVGAGLVVVTLVVYLLGNLYLVWEASRLDQARPVQAIVVMGSAQYAGVPSPDLTARLEHAYQLWRRGLAPKLVVTGGRESGDPYTEAGVSATWLAQRGVPQTDILREVSGRNTWESLDAAAEFLRARGIHQVLLVSDPYHNERIRAIAAELGLHGYVSPTRTSPIHGLQLVPYFAKETLEVSVGRLTSFRVIGHISANGAGKPGS
jgi:uncharacterized SAM-binding protein YcdF (DUF218 family)